MPLLACPAVPKDDDNWLFQMLNFACPKCALQMSFPDSMSGEDVICECGALFTAPGSPSVSISGSNPKPVKQGPPSHKQIGSALIGRAMHPRELVSHDSRKRPNLTTETSDGRQWIGLVVLGGVYAVLQYFNLRGMDLHQRIASENAFSIMLEGLADPLLRLVLFGCVLYFGWSLVRVYRQQHYATTHLRIACAAMIVLLLITGVWDMVTYSPERDWPLRVEWDGDTPIIAEPTYSNWPIATRGLRLLLFDLTVPLVLIFWSRRLEKRDRKTLDDIMADESVMPGRRSTPPKL